MAMPGMYSGVVETVLEAYRSRAGAGGGGSILGQQNLNFGPSQFSLSQAQSQWDRPQGARERDGRELITAKCREALKDVPVDGFHALFQEVRGGWLQVFEGFGQNSPSEPSNGGRRGTTMFSTCSRSFKMCIPANQTMDLDGGANFARY